MAEKEHICTRMVDIIEATGASVANFEKNAAEKGVKVSAGYLRKAAKNDISIGIDLVEYFLAQFPDVNPGWLVTGTGLSRNTEEKGTLAKDMRQVLENTINILRNENTRLLNIVELAMKRGGTDSAQ